MFEVHKLNEQGMRHAAWMQDEFQRFLDRLTSVCGVEGREMAIVRTKLEEACFFAKRAMALDVANQESKP